MRRADRLGAHFAVLLGDDELQAGRATVRDLRAQRDHRVALAIDASGPALVAALDAFTASVPPSATEGTGHG